MIEPAFLRIQAFVAGNVLTLVASAGFYAYLLTHVLFLNYVWGYTLLQAGLAIAPAAFVAAVVAAGLGPVADRPGYRMIVVVGALIWAGSLIWYLKHVGSMPDFVHAWLPGQVLQGIGVGATLPVLGSAGVSGLAAGSSFGTAAAVLSSTRQIGAVIGTPARDTIEEALRRGWALSAVCFVAAAAGGVFLGRAHHVAAEADEPAPVPQIDALPASPPPYAATQRAPSVSREADC